MADGPTNSKLRSSDLRASGSVARPKAKSWRKMYEPLAWTVSTTCGERRSDRRLSVDANDAYLLPGLDLFIGINIWSIGVCPGGRVDGGSLSYQERPTSRRALSVILYTKAGGMDMVLGGPGAGERRKNDAVREGHSTDFERSEESRGLGERRHLSRIE